MNFWFWRIHGFIIMMIGLHHLSGIPNTFFMLYIIIAGNLLSWIVDIDFQRKKKVKRIMKNFRWS